MDGLATGDEKQAFDSIMDLCRLQAMAGSNACNLVLFEPMVMSVLMNQEEDANASKKD